MWILLAQNKRFGALIATTKTSGLYNVHLVLLFGSFLCLFKNGLSYRMFDSLMKCLDALNTTGKLADHREVILQRPEQNSRNISVFEILGRFNSHNQNRAQRFCLTSNSDRL